MPHERKRYARNEALNTLIEFGHFFLGVKRFRHGPTAKHPMTWLLRDISLEVPRGCVVGVVDLGGASRFALLRIIAGISVPHKGKLLRRGSVVGIRQLMALAAPDRTCRENLALLGDLFGIQRSHLDGVLSEVGSTSGLTEALDRTLRRCARGEFLDLAISFVCLLDFDVIVADEINRTVSEQVTDRWIDYISSAPSREQTFFISSRRLGPVFDLSTHLLLLEKGRLRAFGPSAEILVEHQAFIEEALITPLQDLGENPRLDEEEEGGGGEEEDGLGLVDDDLPLPDRTFGPRVKRAATGDGESPAGGMASGTAEPSSDSGLAYITRESPLCEIIFEPGNMVYHPDGSSIVPAKINSPIATITQQLPLVYREDGLLVRLKLAVPKGNVVIRPGVDLVKSKKTPALRLIAPEDFVVREPSRLTVDIQVPSNLLEKIPYTLSAFVASYSDGEPEPDIAILKHYMTIAVTSRADAEATGGPAPSQEAPFPLLHRHERLDVRRIQAENLITLADRWQLRDQDQTAETDAIPEVPQGSPSPFSLPVGRVLVQDEIELSGRIDFKAERSIALRCSFEPPMTLARGHYDLSVRFPDELLPRRDYSVQVSLCERSSSGGTVETHGGCDLSLEAEPVAHDDKTLELLHELPPARASIAVPWQFHVEPLESRKDTVNDR